MSGGGKLIRSSVIMIAIYALANQLAFGQSCPTPELLQKPTKLSKLFPKDPGQKGEFETTAEYEARANLRGPAGPVAFEVVPGYGTITYDADATRFRFTFGEGVGWRMGATPGGNELSVALCGTVGWMNCEQVIQLTTEDIRKSSSPIIRESDVYFVFDGGLPGKVQDLYLTDIPPKEASVLKSRLKLAVLVEPRSYPFYRTKFSLVSSTGTSADTANLLGLNAEIKCVGVLDSKTGSVLVSAEVTYAKPNANDP